MKLGEGGEAFFVFQTEGDIPEDMQTSPIASPVLNAVLPSVIFHRVLTSNYEENGDEFTRTGLSRP